MGGGLMQLVAYGAQDVYLTGNPQITFFKVVYRRHTNFSVESIEQTFNGNADFGRKVNAVISRNGDLIHKMYLQTTLPAQTVGAGEYFKWAENVGHALIKNVEVEIGGQKIDKHYGDWLNIWSELTVSSAQRKGFDRIIGADLNRAPAQQSDFTNGADAGAATQEGSFGAGADLSARTLYIPLQFWFNRNPGLALPLIALQYHEVKVNFEFRPVAELASAINIEGAVYTAADTSDALSNTSLWVDYIYLDTDERRRFAQVSHEYLIEQLQFTSEETVAATTKTATINFNHPVKELIWVAQNDTHISQLQYGNYGTESRIGIEKDNHRFRDRKYGTVSDAGTARARSLNPVSAAKLQLNGHDRFAERGGDYFNFVQPYQHHTRTPSVGINVYSFALNPEDQQPSGTCNFSRIDNASLILTMQDATSRKLRIYAVNYNVLRIMSGMGGLAYSN
jgi:hypothetical protein